MQVSPSAPFAVGHKNRTGPQRSESRHSATNERLAHGAPTSSPNDLTPHSPYNIHRRTRSTPPRHPLATSSGPYPAGAFPERGYALPV
jgi:hypothetical protein